MFEYNGTQFTLEQLQNEATSRNITLEELLKNNPEIKQLDPVEQDFQTPTAPGAVVEETAAPDMESKSDPGSGEFQNKAKIVGAAFNALIGAADKTPTGKGIIQKAQFPVSLLKSGYEFFAENLSEAFVGATETLLNIRSQQLVESDKITKEQRDQLLDASAEEFFDPILDATRGVGDVLRSADQAIDEVSYEDASTTATEDLLSGKIKDGSLKIADGVVEAIPSITAAIYGGPIGYATIFSSASGGAYKSKIEVNPDKRGDAGTFATALSQGGVELISETVTRGILKGFGGTVLEKVAPKAAKNLYKNLTKTLTGRIFTGANLEGISEVAAQETNRYIDKLWDDENAFGYKDENGNYDWGNIIYRASDTYMISSIIGGGLASASKTPQAKIYTEQRLSPDAVKKKTLETVNKISKLEKEYNNNPNDLILDEILELQQSVIDNKVLNEKVLNSFDNAELEQYAINKVKIAEAKEGLNKIKDTETRDVIEARIKKEESKLDNIYNDKLTQLIKILEKPIKPEGVLMSDFGVISAADKLREVALDKATQKKVSNDVQKIYEEQGVDGALDIIEKFRPITNKLVRKRKDAPNYDEQLLRDEIETGERGIFDLIRSYKPDSGVPLSGYINKFLKARAIEASNRVLGKEFTQDVTEIKESKIDLDDTTQETLDFVRTEPKAKEQLRDIAGITKESVQTEAKQILKGKLPGIIEKSGRDKNEILTEINKLSKFKIADSVLEEMGGNFSTAEEQNSRFASFLSSNYDAIIKSIPNSVKNKLPLFEKIDTGNREQTPEGKKIFEYKNPTQEQMLSYYTEGGLTTLRARKKTLADNLAQEIGKDAIAEVLSDPQVQKDFLERQELQGKKIPEGAIPKLLERIDRAISDIEAFEKTTLQSGPVVPAVKIFLKSFKSLIQQGVKFSEALSKSLKEFKKYLKGKVSEDQSQAAVDIINSYIENENDLDGININELNFAINSAIQHQVEMGKQGVRFSSEINKIDIYESIDKNKLSFDLKKTETLKNISKNRLNTSDNKITNEFIKHNENLSKFLPLNSSLLKGNKTFFKGLFGYHRRSTGDGKTKKFYDNFGQNKKVFWISKTTNNLFKNIKEIIPASKFEKIQENISKAKNQKEKIKIAKSNLNDLKNQNENAKTVYNAFNNFLTDYLYGSKNQNEFESRLDYIIKLKRFNSSNIKGERDLALLNGFYFGKAGSVIKLEHVKSSSQQSLESVNSIISGNFDSNIINDFTSIYGYKKQFDIIDKEGRTNTSKYFRFKNKIQSKNFLLVEADFNSSIYEKNIKDTLLKTNKKIKEILNIKENISNADVIKNAKLFDNNNNNNIKKETDNIDLDKEFNNILQNKTGIKSVYRYAKAKAEVAGKDKGSFDYIGIPPSAQDFMGLLYKMVGKGKQGDLQLAWFKKNLLDPFAKAMVDISNTRVALANDFKQIKKIANIAPKVLKNKLPGEPFTVEQAIRVYIWNKQNMDVDGLSQADLKTLTNYVKEDANLLSFADQLIQINKDMAYPKPDKNWLMGTMTTDLLQGLNTTTRKEALSQWQSNVDIIFSEANMNKLEAAFGKGYRSALNNMLQRMQTGRNRGYPGDQLTGRFVDWLNGSVGAIMFFNMRSAVLQTISSVNFINFTDNNPLKAAAAFANQPQFWKDVMFIMNSDYLVERRNGLKINVNEADIAEIAAESKNKAKAFVNKLLKLGFLPTQIADSFAIATGGASFYRNRVKSYIKKGLSEKEAQDKAFLDFREITEENQQSSRPDRISQQQAGPLGRIILAFANTPAQYARIIQRAASDLKNGRGDAKTNISKIIYYGAVQNVIFNAMQQALFAIAFGDEEPDDEKEAEKYGNIVNGMVDSLLRGTGFAGAAVSTVKNAIIKIAKDGNKQDVAIDLINISPPISSKIRKVRSAGRTFDWNKKEIKEKGLSLDNPAAMAIGQLVSATTNVPLDRGIKKLTNIKDALDTENEEWMRIANALGWSKWELEWEQDKRKKKKKKTTGFNVTEFEERLNKNLKK